jgi:hypothetical protein
MDHGSRLSFFSFYTFFLYPRISLENLPKFFIGGSTVGGKRSGKTQPLILACIALSETPRSMQHCTHCTHCTNTCIATMAESLGTWRGNDQRDMSSANIHVVLFQECSCSSCLFACIRNTTMLASAFYAVTPEYDVVYLFSAFLSQRAEA